MYQHETSPSQMCLQPHLPVGPPVVYRVGCRGVRVPGGITGYGGAHLHTTIAWARNCPAGRESRKADEPFWSTVFAVGRRQWQTTSDHFLPSITSMQSQIKENQITALTGACPTQALLLRPVGTVMFVRSHPTVNQLLCEKV